MKIPLKIISNQPGVMSCRLVSSIPLVSSGVSTGVNVQNSAANSVPAKFASSTIPHMRASFHRLPGVNAAMTGNTAVIVVSVNSCWRDSTTMTKPTE